jgi:diguanylate cyclase (GGDEF)-like protein
MNNKAVDIGYKMQPHANDFNNDTFQLLTFCSSWILVRQQWLVDNMRSILTGENTPRLDNMLEFNDTILSGLKLPKNLLNCFDATKSTLENSWHNIIKASHPLSGLTLFEQLNQYQQMSHQFMIDSKEANQRLWYEFTAHDSLTGARTRLTLNRCLADELARTKRYKTPSVIALLDQKNFKSVNDRYGHLIGDYVLAFTAELIQQNLRPIDKLFRYGGDEWLIVMPNTKEMEALITIDRIQRICTDHQFKSNLDESFSSNFSYGVAESNGHNTIKEWLAAADYQLYAKKLKHKFTTNLDALENPQ